MSTRARVERLEQAAGAVIASEYAQAFCDALEEIAATMAERDRAETYAEIEAHLAASAGLNRSRLSFLGARVLSLIERVANGIPAALVMPPALASAWREHDRRFADARPEERARASFDCQTCADCGAEHPWLGRFERNAATGLREVANRDELIKACLLCGGAVGSPARAGRAW